MSADNHLGLQWNSGERYIPPANAIDLAQVNGHVTGVHITASGVPVPHYWFGLPAKGKVGFETDSAGNSIPYRIPGT